MKIFITTCYTYDTLDDNTITMTSTSDRAGSEQIKGFETKVWESQDFEVNMNLNRLFDSVKTALYFHFQVISSITFYEVRSD